MTSTASARHCKQRDIMEWREVMTSTASARHCKQRDIMEWAIRS